MTTVMALGYISRPLLLPGTEVRDAEERLADLARSEALRLGDVFVEEAQTTPDAFGALVEAAFSVDFGVLVVPSMLHLAVLGPPLKVRRHFEYITRTRVLAVSEQCSSDPARRRLDPCVGALAVPDSEAAVIALS